MIAVRDGLQSGAAQWACSKSTPFLASPSMLGVFACGCPPRQPTQSFRSSTAMKRTFGRRIAADVRFLSTFPGEVGGSTGSTAEQGHRTNISKKHRPITVPSNRECCVGRYMILAVGFATCQFPLFHPRLDLPPQRYLEATWQPEGVLVRSVQDLTWG